jgi:DNA repair exonuclease SbcCD ATPase subunit
MSQLTQALTNAVTRNRELLSTLAQTDYADKTLQQNAAYITDLDSQIKATDKELKKLHTQTEDERKDHVKYRDSTFKRYAHKLGGSKGQAKFASKSEKEEREFLQAWQLEREAEERRAELQRALTTATSDRQRFEADKARNTTAQHDLDQLYASIFSGPTPEVPGEDQLEIAVQNAKQHLEQTQSAYNAENAALEALRRVENRMQTAAAAMQEAIDSSRLDIIGMGGSFADMMERDALSKAAVALSESLRHMDEARRWQPDIVHLRTVHIDMGHMVSDVMFDNIFSDMNQHERIKGSNNQLMEAMAQLKEQLAAQVQRAKGATEALKMARASMEEARGELQSIRAEAFERLAGGAGGVGGGVGGYGAAPPPSYAMAEGGFGGYEAQPGYSKV